MTTPGPTATPTPAPAAPGTPPPSTPLPPEWQTWIDQATHWPGTDQGGTTDPAAPTDPAATTTTTPPGLSIDPGLLKQILGSAGGSKPVDPEVTAADTAYLQIWGVAPPKGYVEALVKQGMNVYEIIQHELSKPAADRTAFYRDRGSSIAQTIATAFGRR